MNVNIQKYIFLFVALFVMGCSSGGFSEEDIEKLKTTIKEEFDKKDGIKVVDVQMIKETPTKLTGFVKLKVTGLFGMTEEISKDCSATMGEGSQYIWQCK